MKVCIINNLYKPYSRGGAEKYVEKLMDGFSGLGHENFVISTKPYRKVKKQEDGVYYLSSLYFSLASLPKIIRPLWHLFNMLNFHKYFQVKKIIKLENPDLVITNNLLGLGFLLPRLFLKMKVKHLHVLHDIQLLHPSGLMFLGKEKILDSFFAKIYQRINARLFSELKYVVAPSTWIIDLHKSKMFFQKSKSMQVFNPVAEIPFLKKSKDGAFLNFLYVGQIESHKGLDLLFIAIEDIIKSHSNIFLSLVGTGSLDEVYRIKYGENHRIKFFGRLSEKDIFEKMSSHDCLVVPSLCYENSPTVIYEAGISRLDFIFSDFGGSSEVGNYYSGIGFDPLDPNSLKTALEKFIEKRNGVVHNKKALSLSAEEYIRKILLFL